MNFGTNDEQSSSKPEVWEGIEPYLTGGRGMYAGPTDRYAPMDVNPDWQEWNQGVGQGLFLGPPPSMRSDGYGPLGGEQFNPNQGQTPGPQDGLQFGGVPALEQRLTDYSRDVNSYIGGPAPGYDPLYWNGSRGDYNSWLHDSRSK